MMKMFNTIILSGNLVNDMQSNERDGKIYAYNKITIVYFIQKITIIFYYPI